MNLNPVNTAMIVVGVLLLWSGIKNVSPIDTLKAIGKGEPLPTGQTASADTTNLAAGLTPQQQMTVQSSIDKIAADQKKAAELLTTQIRASQGMNAADVREQQLRQLGPAYNAYVVKK